MDAKNEKELQKEQKNKEKQDALEKECDANFATKKAAKGSPVEQLKVWLDNTPFKSNNTQMKRDTFFAIITQVMALKQPDIDNLCGPGGSLNDKTAISLCKYLFKAFELIGNKDDSKFLHFFYIFI